MCTITCTSICAYNYTCTSTWYSGRINLKQSSCPTLVALLCVVHVYIHTHMYNYLVLTLVAALLLVTWRRSISSSPLVPMSHVGYFALCCVCTVVHTHTYVQLLGTYHGGSVTTWYLAKINLKQSTCPNVPCWLLCFVLCMCSCTHT